MENIVATKYYKIETPQLTLIGDDKGMVHIQPNRGPADTYSVTDLEAAMDEYYRVWHADQPQNPTDLMDMFGTMEGSS